MVGNKKSNIPFLITFAPEIKLLGAKLKKAMDDYYSYTPVIIKTIKLKPLIDLKLKDVDDGTKRLIVGKKIFNVFNDVE